MNIKRLIVVLDLKYWAKSQAVWPALIRVCNIAYESTSAQIQIVA